MEREQIAELIDEFMYEYDPYEYEDTDTDYNVVLETLETSPKAIVDYLEEIDNEDFAEEAERLAKIVKKYFY